MVVRQPIVSVLGHVDHGKTLLLDRIRGSAVQAKEAGGITQQIGATSIPVSVIKRICGDLLRGKSFKVPGLLFIDTPGHEAFTSIRERGGSIADIVVLVVDVMQGVQPQTVESINILKSFRTPFVVALNKIDLINGWRSSGTTSFSFSFNKQSQTVKDLLLERVYKVVAEFGELGFNSDLFTNISDYSRTVALVPCSAVTGEGVAELLMVVMGLCQKYLLDDLVVNPGDEGKGSIIEVKEVKGLGLTIDVILYDGSASVGDVILIATPSGVLKSRVRALLKPAELEEIRATVNYERVSSVSAAAGVKISCKDLVGVVSGMPVIINPKSVEESVKELERSVRRVVFDSGGDGVVVRADSVGSLEALLKIFKDSGVSVRSAGLGGVVKSDVLLASTVKKSNPFNGVVFAFNVDVSEDVLLLAEKEGVKVISSDIIYHLFEEFDKWREELRVLIEREELRGVTFPVKLEVLRGCVFRRFKPCIIGCEVVGGVLRRGYGLMNSSGKFLGVVKELQVEGENVSELRSGEQGAISIDGGARVGRDFVEGDFLFSDVSSGDFKKLVAFSTVLSSEERKVLSEIKSVKRKVDPLWGV